MELLSKRNCIFNEVQRLQLVNDNRRMQDGSISTQSLERVPSSSIYSEASRTQNMSGLSVNKMPIRVRRCEVLNSSAVTTRSYRGHLYVLFTGPQLFESSSSRRISAPHEVLSNWDFTSLKKNKKKNKQRYHCFFYRSTMSINFYFPS